MNDQTARVLNDIAYKACGLGTVSSPNQLHAVCFTVCNLQYISTSAF